MRHLNCRLFVAAIAVMLAMSSCEKAINSEDEYTDEDGPQTITLRVNDFRVEPFETRAGAALTDYCNHIEFAVYNTDGTLVQRIHQTTSTSGYGQASIELVSGTYNLAVIAYSTPQKSESLWPTLANVNKVTFTDQTGYSDTFCYYGQLTVGKQAATHDIELKRASSAVFLTINAALPSDVTHFRVTLNGASRTLDVTTGYGVQTDGNTQSFSWEVDGMTPPITLKHFTFLPTDDATVDITVNATDKNGNIVSTRSFANVPMKHQMKTVYEGDFFDQPTAQGITISADTEIETYQTFQY